MYKREPLCEDGLRNGSIRLRPRLQAAVELLGGARTVADIGCDHGRLACALVQRNVCERVVAIDVSAPSLEKARKLAASLGMDGRVEARLGNGLEPLLPGEADALAILGMGGTEMRRVLSKRPGFGGAERLVIQPMRSAGEIRAWLYEQGCHVLEDRVVPESGRLYQIFSCTASQSVQQPLPDGWPDDCFLVGYTALRNRAAGFDTLVNRMLASVERRRARENAAELDRQARDLTTILRLWEETK